MTTSAGPSAAAEPKLLGPRVTSDLLGRLAARAAMAGPRDPMPVEMPATGKILGQVPYGIPDDVAAAADTARRAQPGWAGTHVTDRSKVLCGAFLVAGGLAVLGDTGTAGTGSL